MKKVYLVLFYILNLWHHVKSNDDETDDDEELVYDETENDRHDIFDEVKHKAENLKQNMVNVGYEFSKALKFIYSNYTNIDLKLADLDLIYRRGIITENQLIILWENLLNTKTDRKLEWMGYNYILSENFTKKINNMWETEIVIYVIYAYIGGFLSYIVQKLLASLPKINLLLIFVLMLLNIVNAFILYSHRFFFSSFISFLSFVGNIGFAYTSLVTLTGNKEVDYSLSYTTTFKSQEHFFTKATACVAISIVINYFANTGLRYSLNYFLFFFYLEKARVMVSSYYHVNSTTHIQPFGHFLCVVTGVINLVSSHTFYYLNIAYAYELSSFLAIYNMFSFYYLMHLDKLVGVMRTGMGNVYLECEKMTERPQEKLEVFDVLKKSYHNERNETFSSENYIDVILIVTCVFFLLAGYYLSSYFYFLISIYILITIHRNCLVLIPIKYSRIISSIFLSLFLLVIYNLDNMNFSYLNEIVSVYDKKFIEAIKLLFKFLFLVVLCIANYFTEEFFNLFNIYNYSSYSYVVKELYDVDNPQEVMKTFNEIYTIENTLPEIFCFNLAKSLKKVNYVIDSMNCNIDAFYIEHLITRAASNIHIVPLIFDYFSSYFNYLMILLAFRDSNNHTIFYLTLLVQKIGIFLKWILIILEYSKTNLQKNTIITLNIVISLRILMGDNNDYTTDQFDVLFMTILYIYSIVLYMAFLDNYNSLNFFIIILLTVYYQKNRNLFMYSVLVGILIAKSIVHYLRLRNNIKYIIMIVFSISACILAVMIDPNTIDIIYNAMKKYTQETVRIDLLGAFERLCNLNSYSPEFRLVEFLTTSVKNFKYNIF